MDSQEKKSKFRKVKCPHCGRLTFYSPENPFRPFCSERCRVIDLGQWADESYRIPLEQTPSMNPLEIPEEDSDNYQ